MRVRLQPKQTGDQRAREGTKSDRRDDKARRGARYVVLVAVAFVVALGVGYLARKAVSASHQSSTTAKLTRHVASLTKADSKLVARVAGLGKANAKLVARVAMDERQTCKIQARGLPAGHFLATAMGDINELLSLQTPAQLAKLPPFARDLLTSLHTSSGQYKKIEANQPQHRSCS